VPLRWQQHTLGILEVFASEPNAFGDREIRTLQSLAGIITSAALRTENQPSATAVDPADAAEPDSPAEPEPRVARAEVGESLTTPGAETRVAAAPEVGVPAADPFIAHAAAIADTLSQALNASAPCDTDEQIDVAAEPFSDLIPDPETELELISAESRPRWRAASVFGLVVIALVLVAGYRNTALRKKFQPWRASGLAALIHRNAPPPAKPAVLDAVPAGPAELPSVVAVRHLVRPEGTQVTVDLDGVVLYEARRLHNPNRIFFDLRDARLAAELLGNKKEGTSIEVDDPLVSRIRVGQREAGVVRVVLDLKSSAEFSAVLSPDPPYRFEIAVRGASVATRGSTTPAGADTTAAGVEPSQPTGPFTTAGRRLRIVIDPGHGGHDLGTVANSGLLEKALVLDISRRLGKLLQKAGAELVYTRTEDYFVPLETRTSIANQMHADLFISIHGNASEEQSARGVETYYLEAASSPDALKVALRENAAGSIPAGTPGVRPAAAREKVTESRQLAFQIQRALHASLALRDPRLKDRGVKQAPLVVLTGASMPAILAEVSFLSSPTDAQKLQSLKYRDSVAEALYRGIVTYLGLARQKPETQTASMSGMPGK
jgi:N-acetylmuramoyl-L-alanine amidase